MLSRRIIRVKAMQTLFSNEIGKDINATHLEKQLSKSIKNTQDLYFVFLMYLIEICNYSIIYYLRNENKISKDKDILVNSDLSNNPIINMINTHQEFKDYINFNKIHTHINQKLVKKLFLKLIEKEKYKKYISTQNKTQEDNIGILRFIIKKIIGASQDLEEYLFDNFLNIEDDLYFILLNIQKKLKIFENKNETLFLRNILLQDNQKEILTFAKDLVIIYCEHEEEFISIIKPKLKKWDIERVANIDLVILKMAISELKFFPNIPIKVTFNEYIDIVKEYSSANSKDFINGILDKIMKELKEKGELKKQGRGLIN